jgi:hypothetical protein
MGMLMMNSVSKRRKKKIQFKLLNQIRMQIIVSPKRVIVVEIIIIIITIIIKKREIDMMIMNINVKVKIKKMKQ